MPSNCLTKDSTTVNMPARISNPQKYPPHRFDKWYYGLVMERILDSKITVPNPIGVQTPSFTRPEPSIQPPAPSLKSLPMEKLRAFSLAAQLESRQQGGVDTYAALDSWVSKPGASPVVAVSHTPSPPSHSGPGPSTRSTRKRRRTLKTPSYNEDYKSDEFGEGVGGLGRRR